LQFSEFNSSNVDNTASLRYLGILLGEVDYLPGTNAEYATELFNPSKNIEGKHSIVFKDL
jgi:hypothetical protein